MCKVRSENGYGFLKPGLKTGVGNGIFWSEIGSGFGKKIPRSTPPGINHFWLVGLFCAFSASLKPHWKSICMFMLHGCSLCKNFS